jgi:hypothetical protein
MVKKAALMVLCLAPVVAAAGPATRPAESARARAFAERAGMVHRPDSRDDFEQALKFFKDFSQKRFAAFEDMTDEQKAKLRPAINARYHAYRFLVSDNPKLKDVKERQLKIEDDIFGIKKGLDDTTDPAEKNKLQDELKKRVAELIESRMDERRMRISRLEELLKEEKGRLEKDIQRKDQLVEDRYKDVLTAKESPDKGRTKPPAGERGAKPPRRER